MWRRDRSGRPALITTAPENPDAEFGRRRRRYAITAAVCLACFTAGGLVARDSTLAGLLLCAAAAVLLVAAVFGANTRSRPRRSARPRRPDNGLRQLPAPLAADA